MKKNSLSCLLFAGAAAVLAAAVLLICATQRDAVPKILVQPTGSAACIQGMVQKINQGDFAGASKYLYGTPQLDAQKQRSTDVAQQIWNAYTGSVECSLVGESYATASGVSQDVRMRSLEIPNVMAALKAQAQSLLEQRVERAEHMQDIYDEDHEYRQEFLDQVLHDAAELAIAGGAVTEQQLTLNLVFDRGQWWVVPDQALLSAISGGILK